jgi:hypothetical protein
MDAEDLPDPDTVFERRLAMVLDGLAATVHPPLATERRSPPRGGTPEARSR